MFLWLRITGRLPALRLSHHGGTGCAWLFTSFGNGVLRPAITSEISRSVERYEEGTVLGLNQSLQSVAQILAPLASTFLIGHRLLTPWAWFPAAICMLGLWLCVRMPREAAVQMN